MVKSGVLRRIPGSCCRFDLTLARKFERKNIKKCQFSKIEHLSFCLNQRICLRSTGRGSYFFAVPMKGLVIMIIIMTFLSWVKMQFIIYLRMIFKVHLTTRTSMCFKMISVKWKIGARGTFYNLSLRN